MTNLKASTGLAFTSADGALLTTSLLIAKALQRDHENVIRLIRNHEQDLNQFNNVVYSSKDIVTNGGLQSTTSAYLNEQQATLLITFMSNSRKVIDFKIALVKSFYELRQQLAMTTQQYTPDAIAEIKNKAIKQGYAMAYEKAREEYAPDSDGILRYIKDECKYDPDFKEKLKQYIYDNFQSFGNEVYQIGYDAGKKVTPYQTVNAYEMLRGQYQRVNNLYDTLLKLDKLNEELQKMKGYMFDAFNESILQLGQVVPKEMIKKLE